MPPGLHKPSATTPATMPATLSDKLKILQLSSGDLWAGAEVQLYTLACALHDSGEVELVIVLFNHGELERRLREKGLNVQVLDETRLDAPRILARLLDLIKQQQPDIVHTHRQKENILGSLAAGLQRRPSLRTAHGAPEYQVSWRQPAKKMFRLADRFCGRWLQRRIVAVSTDLAGKLEATFPAKKITVIENGIALDGIAPRQPVTADASAPVHIAIAGRLVPVKRVDLFLQIAAQLEAAATPADHPVRFTVYGSGPLEDALKQQASDLRLKNLHFAGHQANMHQHLPDIDILLITSDHEGLPMILLEAMAHGINVVSHAVGGIPRVLDDGACGCLVGSQQAGDYVDAIQTLLNQPERRKQLARKARERVESRYSATQNALAYLQLYRQLE